MSKIDLNQYLGGERQQFFKASELKTTSAKIKIKNVREAELPFSGKSVIIDFDYKKQERSLPLNKTNLRKLITLLGSDTEKWIGKEITLIKVLVTNPKTKQVVESIRIK